MPVNPCKDESLLSALMDEALPAKHAAAVRRHMESCAVCRQRFEALQHTDAMLRDMEPLEPSPEFEQTFWRKVAELGENRPQRSWLRFLLSGWRPLLATGVMAGLMAAILIYTGQEKRLTPEEVFIAQHMDLLQDYDLIDQLDMLEQWDVIEVMKEPS